MTCQACGKDEDDESGALEIDWIYCSECDNWFHSNCVGLRRSEMNRISEYHCDKCIKKAGPSVLKRTSSRHHKKIDYVALNDGEDVREVNRHPHIEDFASFKNDEPLENLVYLVDPARDGNSAGIVDDEQLMKIISDTKLKRPILIRGCNPSVAESYNDKIKLSFKFPRLSIGEVAEYVGEDAEVPVMDVQTQNNSSSRWTMARWRDYFEQDREDRDRIRNVISLEFSETDLGPQVELPQVVRDVDIVTRLYSSSVGERLAESGVERPKVTKYVLMSVADSFTDFHIDFAGTSVYYTIMSGRKQFLMYPPTDRNLTTYKKWCGSDDQNSLWLGDLIPRLSLKEKSKLEHQGIDPSYINNGIKIDINAGDLLLLPSGWIHSVYTPSDSLIIGGNFLNLLSLENHLKTYEIEIDTKVPEKFKFPNFVRIVWLVGYYLLIEKPQLSAQELECLASLERFYRTQWDMTHEKNKVHNKKMNTVLQHVRKSIPSSIIGDVDRFIRNFSKWYHSTLESVDIELKDDAESCHPSKRIHV